MNDTIHSETLRTFFLWNLIRDAHWEQLHSAMKYRRVCAGEEIEISGEELYVLWQGKIKVYAAGEDSVHNHTTLLRTMESGAVFGVNAVFASRAEAMSRPVAVSACVILQIPVRVWETILIEDAETMKRYIRFLTGRIEFLNQKVRYLTAGSSERKLAAYLFSTLPTDGSYAPLPMPAANLADLLNLGRASLYRAIHKLMNDGFLLQKDKRYALLQRDELLDFYQ